MNGLKIPLTRERISLKRKSPKNFCTERSSKQLNCKLEEEKARTGTYRLTHFKSVNMLTLASTYRLGQ